MHNLLPVLAAALLACIVIVMLVRESQQERHRRLRAIKLRSSPLFAEILPMLRAVEHHHIEQLMVDKTGISIRYLQPIGTEVAFLMRPHHYAYLTLEQQEALREVLEEYLPILRDSAHYGMYRKRIRLINGDIEYRYRYTIVSAYKARLSRAHYYDGSLQANLW